MSLDFYDYNGTPIAYTDDETHIFTFSGEPVAYIDGDSVYSFRGSHIGRFDSGLIRDNGGDVVFFTDGASGGPLKPLKKLKPLKGLKKLKPLKGLKVIKPLKPLNSSSWSALSDEQFFA